MDGTLTFEDCSLHDFLHLFNINRRSLGTHPLQAVLRSISKRLRTLQQYNPIGRAQDHVAHHYDLSRDLYELFLDKDLQYSCGYFANENDSLETAQLNKKKHIAAKLCLEPGQRVLDIGCGWGGLGLFLATAGRCGSGWRDTVDRAAQGGRRTRGSARSVGSRPV